MELEFELSGLDDNDLDDIPQDLSPEEFNSLDVAAPLIELPISREGIQAADFQISTSEEIAMQSADAELKQLRQWIEVKRTSSTDELAPLSVHLKCYAQLLSEMSLHDSVIILRRSDDPQRELIVVPSSLIERVIRFFHEGPGGAHQAAKATAAKIISRFFWPDLKRDVRLYVACCPTCERFLRLGRNPRAGLRPMNVGGRGDCVSMDIVGGKGSLPETPRGNNYILTIIDCFTRYAVAIPLPDQSASVIISAILGSFITVYGTPRTILTDQGRNFESSEFLEFCKLFRIHKIRTTSYHPQSNGLCERFNQTLKSGLRKVLHESQFPSWDLYLNFVVFSYNTSIHSSTKFSPFYLTFASEVRLPPDLIFGSPLSQLQDESTPQRGPLPSLLKSFHILSCAFNSVRENLQSFHQREKDYYDVGAVERIFTTGDIVRVILKSRAKGPSKFQSEWSTPHRVISVKCVVVTLQEIDSDRKYVVHHDRLSNPLLSGKEFAARELEANSNFQENEQDPEEDFEPVVNPEEALIHTRSGRTVKSTKKKDFE